MPRHTIIAALLLTASAAAAQGVPSLPIPGAGALNPAQGAPPPPTKKLPNGECVTPQASNYEMIRNFVPFVSLADCLKSGGRPAKGNLPMGSRKPS